MISRDFLFGKSFEIKIEQQLVIKLFLLLIFIELDRT